MKNNRTFRINSGLFAVLCYLGFTTLAFSQYPLSYSPMKNWLSDLGNRSLNPGGSFFYNLGIISTALLLIVFFLSFSEWKIMNKKVQNFMIFLTQTFGILGSMCMLMSAIFPINFLKVHSFWSAALYIMLSTAFVFSAAALRYFQKIPGGLIALGISTALMVILWSFFKSMHLLEWITLLLFLIYVSILSFMGKRLISGCFDDNHIRRQSGLKSGER